MGIPKLEKTAIIGAYWNEAQLLGFFLSLPPPVTLILTRVHIPVTSGELDGVDLTPTLSFGQVHVQTDGITFEIYYLKDMIVQYTAMMTSSNGNIFRVTGHLCGKFTGPRWISHTKASDAELWCLLWSKQLSKQWRGWWFETPSWSLWRHRNGISYVMVVQHYLTVCY